jgi:hypothetical protein
VRPLRLRGARRVARHTVVRDVLTSGIFWTGLVGLAGIAASIFAAKKSAETALAQVDAERERQVGQHAEDHRRNRQATYHLFLTAAAQLRATRGEVAESEEAEKARWEFLHLLHGVELFGTEDVRQAAARVTSVLERLATRHGTLEIVEQPPGYVGPKARAAVRALAELLREEEVADRMNDLLEAMRADVAPDRGRPVAGDGGGQRRVEAGRSSSRPAHVRRLESDDE